MKTRELIFELTAWSMMIGFVMVIFFACNDKTPPEVVDIQAEHDSIYAANEADIERIADSVRVADSLNKVKLIIELKAKADSATATIKK